jgi:hypothetical protein
MKILRLVIVVLASLLPSSSYIALSLVMAVGLASVKADSVMEWLPSPSGYIGYTSGWLPQFNPTNGQLTNIVLQFGGSYSASGPVFNNTSSNISFTISLTGGDSSMIVSNSSLQANGSWNGGGGGSVGPNSMTGAFAGGMVNGGFAETSQATNLNFFTGTNFVFVSLNIGPPTVFVNPLTLSLGGGPGCGWVA